MNIQTEGRAPITKLTILKIFMAVAAAGFASEGLSLVGIQGYVPDFINGGPVQTQSLKAKP